MKNNQTKITNNGKLDNSGKIRKFDALWTNELNDEKSGGNQTWTNRRLCKYPK